MPITFLPKVPDLGLRSGIPRTVDLSTNFNSLQAIARICKIYSTILEDVERLDPYLSQPEAKAIFRIVEEVQRKLFQKTFDQVLRSCDSGGGNLTGRDGSSTEESDGSSTEESDWLEKNGPQLRELQATLSRQRQRFHRTQLSLATPIELLCRLVGVQLGTQEWDIDHYVDQLGNLKISRLLAAAHHANDSYYGCGLPSKVFICVGPHNEGVHIIASSADHFDWLSKIADWAKDAHNLRKKKYQGDLEQLKARVDLFYEESKPFEGDWVKLWNFIHRWKITNTPQPSAADSTPTNFDETAAALDVARGLVVCAGCFKCRAVHTYKLSDKSIRAECDFPGSLGTPRHHPSCSCCEDLGSLFCLSIRRTASQKNIPS